MQGSKNEYEWINILEVHGRMVGPKVDMFVQPGPSPCLLSVLSNYVVELNQI